MLRKGAQFYGIDVSTLQNGAQFYGIDVSTLQNGAQFYGIDVSTLQNGAQFYGIDVSTPQNESGRSPAENGRMRFRLPANALRKPVSTIAQPPDAKKYHR
jgi:hypothetical protein